MGRIPTYFSGRKSVDQIIGGLTGLMEELVAARTAHLKDRDKKTEQMARLQNEVDAHSAEADRAQFVYDNIKGLITPK